MVYPSLLPLMRTPRLPVVDWTDAPADLNGLVRFAERWNLVSARVPSHFKSSLLKDYAALWTDRYVLKFKAKPRFHLGFLCIVGPPLRTAQRHVSEDHNLSNIHRSKKLSSSYVQCFFNVLLCNSVAEPRNVRSTRVEISLDCCYCHLIGLTRLLSWSFQLMAPYRCFLLTVHSC